VDPGFGVFHPAGAVEDSDAVMKFALEDPADFFAGSFLSMVRGICTLLPRVGFLPRTSGIF